MIYFEQIVSSSKPDRKIEFSDCAKKKKRHVQLQHNKRIAQIYYTIKCNLSKVLAVHDIT